MPDEPKVQVIDPINKILEDARIVAEHLAKLIASIEKRRVAVSFLQQPTIPIVESPTNEPQLFITSVSVAHGTMKSNPTRRWTRYEVTFSDKRVASTFDESIGLLAQGCESEKASVRRIIDKDTKGYWRLVELVKLTTGECGEDPPF